MNKNLRLIIRLFLLLLTGCDNKLDMETGISAFSYLNPEGDIFAVLVGLKVKGWDRCALSDTHPVLLKLNEQSMLIGYRQLDDWVFRDMAWRPNHDNQLYFVTFGKIFDFKSTGPFGEWYDTGSGKWFKLGEVKLFMLEADSNGHFPTLISQRGDSNISSCFRWSPDGKTLAGLAIKQVNQRMEINSGELVISFDGGKTSKLTGIEMSGYPVWINDTELYLNSRTDENTILKVLREGLNFKITEKLTKDFDIELKGSFQEKLVYNASSRKDIKGKSLDKVSRLFVGDQLIYETDDLYLQVFVFTDRIVVEADRKVIIFDKNLSVCHELYLARKTRLLNFQPNTNTVFLVKDWKTILCYNYTKKEKPHVLFSVDMLDKPLN